MEDTLGDFADKAENGVGMHAGGSRVGPPHSSDPYHGPRALLAVEHDGSISKGTAHWFRRYHFLISTRAPVAGHPISMPSPSLC